MRDIGEGLENLRLRGALQGKQAGLVARFSMRAPKVLCDRIHSKSMSMLAALTTSMKRSSG